MHLRLILKYVVLPVLIVGAIGFALFHRSIIRHFRVSWCFDTIVSEDTNFEKAEAAFNTIMSMGLEAEPYLLDKAVKNPVLRERKIALYLLGNLKSQNAVPLLLKSLEDNEEMVRLGAVQGLKYMMRSEFVKPVGALVKDPSPEVRRFAADALGNTPPAGAAQAAATLLVFIQNEYRRYNVRNWYESWMAYSKVVAVNGVIELKTRLDDRFEVLPDNDKSAKLIYTYYFLRIREADGGEKRLCVPMSMWDGIQNGMRISKPACAKPADAKLLPPLPPAPAPAPDGKAAPHA